MFDQPNAAPENARTDDPEASKPGAPAPCGTAALIDVARYPIHDLDGPGGRALLARCRTALEREGCVVLRDFVRPDALARMTEEGRARVDKAHFNRTRTNPYSSEADPSLPSGHPVNRFLERTNGFVAGDLLEPETAMRRLYHDESLRGFIARCMGVERLYEYADPLAGLVVNVLRPGCQHPWHFDNNDFIVSLLTQAPESGGLFEYCPGLRSADDQNIAGVKGVLQGDREPVTSLQLRPGDLQVFYGRNSLHRVTKVEGPRERHTLILGYTDAPGQIADAARTKRLFGRIHDAHREAEAAGRTRDSVDA
ncbi:MAG: hypothetical protein RIB45_14075 [Marivibrio sp.]|uniref:HalD/BesD family halogenase n=1 Tax=Marivibrio sp. TaxID=2039719 RepID=UPI0032EF99E2